jgi:integrase
MKLTLRNAAALTLPPGKSDYIYFDDDIAGFGLRIREGGSRSWIYQYRVGAKQRRLVIGSARAVPLPLARENAGRLEAEIRLGGDPAMKKEVGRHEAEHTFGALADQYLQAHMSSWRPVTASIVTRHLKVYAKSLGHMPITAISQRNVANLLNTVAASVRGRRIGLTGDVSANRLRASLSAMFAWVMGEGVRLPEGNPASHTNVREEKARDRVLSDDELKIIWNAAGDGNYGCILRLLMLTGQRADEIGGLQWGEIAGDKIELPAARTKNKRAHTVPLSEPALAILAGVKRGDRIYVFGRTATAPFSGWSKAKRKLAAHTGALPPWTVHDLRRTCATGMADIGIQPHIIEAVLNHVSGHKAGVAGVYNRSSYDREKRAALSLWAEHVLAVVEGRATRVVPLKRA